MGMNSWDGGGAAVWLGATEWLGTPRLGRGRSQRNGRAEPSGACLKRQVARCRDNWWLHRGGGAAKRPHRPRGSDATGGGGGGNPEPPEGHAACSTPRACFSCCGSFSFVQHRRGLGMCVQGQCAPNNRGAAQAHRLTNAGVQAVGVRAGGGGEAAGGTAADMQAAAATQAEQRRE